MHKVAFDIIVAVVALPLYKILRLIHLVYSTCFFTCHFEVGFGGKNCGGDNGRALH